MTASDNTLWLDECLAALPQARVAVFGDFCLDAYWLIDPDESEKSIETGRIVRRVRQQRYSPGGAGNIVANLSALGVARVEVVGMVGQDMFGRHMRQLLEQLPGIGCDGLLECRDDWQTPVYAKPCLHFQEQDRLDFGSFNRLDESTMDMLAARLERAADACDVIVLNQQLPRGASPAEMIERINGIVARHAGRRFIVDARHRLALYRGCAIKLNVHEASRLLGLGQAPARVGAETAVEYACRLRQRFGRDVFLTRGENGLVVAHADGVDEIPGIQITGPVDPVGAGDTALAALAAALACGQTSPAAGKLANIAASISVRKLQTTGTAAPAEIRAVGARPDYVHLPDLADDPSKARTLEGTRIEIVRPPAGPMRVAHVLFDHDGTLSTLRHGWEAVMEPMMAEAILGGPPDAAEASLRQDVLQVVRDFIDKSTGIQTLSQMQALVGLVRQFGCVREEDILDLHGYKRLYDRRLMAIVQGRIDRLRRGEVSPAQFEVAGARELLEALTARGVRLYLASGTDREHVIAEAQALGYAGMFQGRIFGAVGDVRVEAKAAVLERIFSEHRLAGPELLTFGDGPVEIRLTQRRGGLTVGVASDETRRCGLDLHKRSRLIRAGADIVIGDYRELSPLLALLGLDGGRVTS